ncbi:MAG TPA: aminotransferase class V-fold PLP-dependent enzyme [Abditibacteriaceae bacterium]|nr:aminotransferase class V-fold PLP-dependent enzyme [Abditibacteriaceae bacterium]
MLTRRDFMGGFAAGVLASCAAVKADPKVVEASLESLRGWVAAGASWQALRQQFLLDPAAIYLNTGTLGACPQVVVDAHVAFLRQVEANPAVLLFGSMGDQMESVRQKAAQFLGADLTEVALTPNTTTGMNVVASGLPWRAGDEVLTTNQEHAGGHVCWEYARDRWGVVIREVAIPTPAQTEAEVLGALKAAITEHTKVISISHVNTITGLRMPVAKVAELARQSGAYLVVDGAQAPGMLNVDVHALGCDAYASSSHKWMLAPKGCGLLYLRREFQQYVKSAFLQSGMGAYTAATGTRNVPQILSHGVAMNFHNLIGRQRIEERDLALARRLRERLLAVKNLEVVSSASTGLQSGILTVKLKSWTGEAASSELFKRKGFVVKAVPGEHLEGRAIRLSTHFYNTERELDLLVQELEQMATKN